MTTYDRTKPRLVTDAARVRAEPRCPWARRAPGRSNKSAVKGS